MKIPKSENIISLIHNYCDRWCERCPFTSILLKIFPQEEDEILHFLISLERLRNNIEFKFPNARDFVRPGFDE